MIAITIRFKSGLCTHLYRPQRSWGKVIFSQACVILFTGGVWRQTPPDQAPIPPGPDPPRDQAPPPHQALPPGTRPPPKKNFFFLVIFFSTTPPDTVYVRAVCILLECFLVVIAISIHPIDKNRNRITNLGCEWTLNSVPTSVHYR